MRHKRACGRCSMSTLALGSKGVAGLWVGDTRSAHGAGRIRHMRVEG